MECRLSVRAENALVTYFLTHETVTPKQILMVDWERIPQVGRKAMLEIVEFANDLNCRGVTDAKQHLYEWRKFMAKRLAVTSAKNRRKRNIAKPDTRPTIAEAAFHIFGLLACNIKQFRAGGGDISDYEFIPNYLRDPIEWLAKVSGQTPHEVLSLYFEVTTPSR
jgi:hypothetical protein